jgi:predicted transcriptional regulator
MAEGTVIFFSEQSKYGLADELLKMISNGGPWSDTVLFSEFCTSAKSNIDYSYRKDVIDDLQNKYELFAVNKDHSVTLTKRGEEVIDLGIEKYNRRIAKRNRLENIVKISLTIVMLLASLSTIYFNMCSSGNPNDKNDKIELINK